MESRRAAAIVDMSRLRLEARHWPGCFVDLKIRVLSVSGGSAEWRFSQREGTQIVEGKNESQRHDLYLNAGDEIYRSNSCIVIVICAV